VRRPAAKRSWASTGGIRYDGAFPCSRARLDLRAPNDIAMAIAPLESYLRPYIDGANPGMRTFTRARAAGLDGTAGPRL